MELNIKTIGRFNCGHTRSRTDSGGKRREIEEWVLNAKDTILYEPLTGDPKAKLLHECEKISVWQKHNSLEWYVWVHGSTPPPEPPPPPPPPACSEAEHIFLDAEAMFCICNKTVQVREEAPAPPTHEPEHDPEGEIDPDAIPF